MGPGGGEKVSRPTSLEIKESSRGKVLNNYFLLVRTFIED